MCFLQRKETIYGLKVEITPTPTTFLVITYMSIRLNIFVRVHQKARKQLPNVSSKVLWTCMTQTTYASSCFISSGSCEMLFLVFQEYKVSHLFLQ